MNGSSPDKRWRIAAIGGLLGGFLAAALTGYLQTRDLWLAVSDALVIYGAIVVVLLALRYTALRVLRLDAQGSMPWYASPLIWLGPVFLYMLYRMFAA